MASPLPTPPRIFFEITTSWDARGKRPVGITRTERMLGFHLLLTRP